MTNRDQKAAWPMIPQSQSWTFNSEILVSVAAPEVLSLLGTQGRRVTVGQPPVAPPDVVNHHSAPWVSRPRGQHWSAPSFSFSYHPGPGAACLIAAFELTWYGNCVHSAWHVVTGAFGRGREGLLWSSG